MVKKKKEKKSKKKKKSEKKAKTVEEPVMTFTIVEEGGESEKEEPKAQEAPPPPQPTPKEEKKIPVTLKEDGGEFKQAPPKKEEKHEEMEISVSYPKSAGGSWQERFENILNDVLARIEHLENNYNLVSDSVEEIKEHVNDLETNMHELTALYDALSAQYNPFIELKPKEIEDEMSEESNGDEIVMEESAEELEPEAVEMEEPSEMLELEEDFEEKEVPEKKKIEYLLPTIPDNSLSNMMAIKWTEFMLEKVGPRNIGKLLEYYRSMHWISDAVVRKIMHQVMGLITDNFSSEYDTWKMSTDDHMKSLVFIEKIKGGEVGTIHAEEVQELAEDIKKG